VSTRWQGPTYEVLDSTQRAAKKTTRPAGLTQKLDRKNSTQRASQFFEALQRAAAEAEPELLKVRFAQKISLIFDVNN